MRRRPRAPVVPRDRLLDKPLPFRARMAHFGIYLQASRFVIMVSDPAQHALVLANLDVVERAARLIYPRVRTFVELNDLVAMGNEGLVQAAQRFDASRGVPFGGYAWYRVNGAIIDGLRRMTTLPRATWRTLLALRAANDFLEHQQQRSAAVATAGGAPLDRTDALRAAQAALGAVRTIHTISLDAARERGVQVAAPEQDTAASLQASQEASEVRSKLAALPDRERALLHKHYFEGKTLEQAGEELGISKSWASRIHAQAVERMRLRLLHLE